MSGYLPDPNDCTVVLIDGKPYKRQVVAAANKYRECIVVGARHFDSVMNAQIDAANIDVVEQHDLSNQGFIDQWGNFMDRKEAMKVGVANGRFMRNTNLDPNNIMFSEDNY